MEPFFIVILLFVVFIVMSVGVVVVKEDEVTIIERLGAYHLSIQAGIHYVIPFIDKKVASYTKSQNDLFISKKKYVTYDDSTLELSMSVSYQIIEPKLFHYGLSKDKPKFFKNFLEDKVTNQMLKTNKHDFQMDIEEFKSSIYRVSEEAMIAVGIKLIDIKLEKHI